MQLNNASDAIDALAGALSKAQGEIEAALKSAENPHFRSKYADLASIWDAARIPLSKHGLSVVQTLNGSNPIVLETTLLHSSGQWIRGAIPLILVKQDMQGLGSAITYARRYCLAAICGVAQDDDDANLSVARNKAPVASAKPVAATTPASPQSAIKPARSNAVQTKPAASAQSRADTFSSFAPHQEDIPF